MTTGELISNVLGALMFIVAAYLAFSRRSQQRQVTMDPGVATKSEFDKLTAHNDIEHAKLWAKLDADRSAFETNASMRSKGIYDTINEVRVEMKNDLQKQTTELRAMNESMPERLIQLLKNTGAIGGKHG